METEEQTGRCLPARCGTAWGGYGAAWAAWGAPSRCPRTIRASNTAFRVFTRHESRDMNHESRLLLWRGKERLWRGMSGILPPRGSPLLPPPSWLVSPRRTPNEPMPRKTNVLDCANEATFYMTMTPDRTAPGTVPLNRYNRLAWTSHRMARNGAAVRGKTVRTRSGSPGALLPCPLLAVTGNRPVMSGGLAVCFDVRPGRRP